ncbi:ATP-binding protein [Pseudomonas sp.]|uniref:sensor histidine kinase n=1 Tax=Pseudomonas sp. TaxID=306 RepID=UPI0027374204|nr:ATP-binding protein [Pseudomonas sp.]MDP3816635.1 ATP-binding protein [Pseudomonas sp.]
MPIESTLARRWWLPIASGLALMLLYSAWLLLDSQASHAQTFETDSRILHRLLTQRAEQHEAIFAALLAAEATVAEQDQGLLQSFAVALQHAYPQVAGIERYRQSADGQWQQMEAGHAPAQTAVPAVVLDSASSAGALTVLADADGYFRLLRKSPAGSVHSIRIATQRLLEAEEKPPATMSLQLTTDAGLTLWQVPAERQSWPWLTPLEFHKALSSRSQPLLLSTRQPPLAETLPWLRWLAGLGIIGLACALFFWAFEQYQRSRLAQRRLLFAQASRISSMGELAAGIAHEVNQPLTAILATSQALAHLIDDEPPDLAGVRQAAANLARHAKRAGAIIHRLRQFISPQTSQATAVELKAVVEEALALLQESFKQQQIRVSTALPGGLPPVLGDAVGLEQVLVNLLLNASEAMAELSQRHLHISLQRAGQKLLLEISDSGPGLDAESSKRLFEPFYTTKPAGLGLGLSICASIVEQSAGQLSARNGPAGGCILSLTLPLFA